MIGRRENRITQDNVVDTQKILKIQYGDLYIEAVEPDDAKNAVSVKSSVMESDF